MASYAGGGGSALGPSALYKPGSGPRRTGGGSASMGSGLSTNRTLGGGTAPAAPVAPYDGGDYGGGGTGGAPAPAPRARMSLSDVIANDFGFNARRAENDRLLNEFDAESTRMRGETERDQAVRRAELTDDINRLSVDNAEDMAGRGLLRSGGTFQNQQRINDDGTRRGMLIDQLLTDLLSNRAQGRLAQEARNRDALNEVQQKIASQYMADPNLGLI